MSYTVQESANFSNTLLSYAEKAFASAESSCLLLTIRCTGTEHLIWIVAIYKKLEAYK